MARKVLFVSAEVAPYAKVGGLADVAGSLPLALREQGVDVRVAMPAYAMVANDPRWKPKPILHDVPVDLNPWWRLQMQVDEVDHRGVPLYLIGTDRWFQDADRPETIYRPGIEQYLFFSAAAMEMCRRLDWIPDVVHAHDWHTGFLPVLVREKGGTPWSGTATAFTIHNLAYQGVFGPEILEMLGLPHALFSADKVEAWGSVNFLKAGAACSDVVNTVSPTYAREIQTGEYGCMLDGLMKHLDRQGRLFGILNGLDTGVWNPACDPLVDAHYSADDLAGKAVCRQNLTADLGLATDDNAPLFGMVSRLSDQKGFDLVLAIAPSLVEQGAALVVQGLGDPWLIDQFCKLEHQFPSRVKLIDRFDEHMAHRVYSGCDAFLMPSKFEPCGLGQMIAMRYGTVPVVRATGGLADTVHDGINGFVFQEPHARAMDEAVRRSIVAFRDKPYWRRLVDTGMRENFAWDERAEAYLRMYEAALDRRRSETRLAG